jgi:hypothetical protein
MKQQSCNSRKHRAWIHVLAALTAMIVSAIPAQAAIITVTNNNNSGAGSLRAAILAAAPSGDTIVFSNNLCQTTITLTSGPLTFRNPQVITIDASGCGVTISGNNSRPVLLINPNANVYLNSITITKGFNSDITSTGFGGGIINAGLIQLLNCTMNDNHATLNGGAISSSAFIIIINSTITGNSAGTDGASIYTTTTPLIYNSTFSNNTSLGSSIYSSEEISLSNTIMNDAATASGGNCAPVPVTAGTDNQANDATCGSAQVVTSAQLNLGPLQNNAGPTRTMALLPGSSAIDAGSNADSWVGLTYDQRGIPFTRIVNTTVDVGAFEYRISPCPAHSIQCAY